MLAVLFTLVADVLSQGIRFGSDHFHNFGRLRKSSSLGQVKTCTDNLILGKSLVKSSHFFNLFSNDLSFFEYFQGYGDNSRVLNSRTSSVLNHLQKLVDNFCFVFSLYRPTL